MEAEAPPRWSRGVSYALAYTAADLVFDPATHTTTRPDGVTVPHVTGILSAVGVTTDFEQVSMLSRRVARAVDLALARGTAVHADCHAYDDDDLDWDSVHPVVRPYVLAWVEVREALGLTPVAHQRERLVYSQPYHYCGIIDGLFVRDGQYVLADIKTGDPEDAAAHLQLAAYELAVEHTFSLTVSARLAIWLRPERRRLPYTVIDYTSHPDAAADRGNWLACLATYNQQPTRRERRR